MNKQKEVEVVEWHHVPAMHGPQLRHISEDGPFRFTGVKQFIDTLLTPAFAEMGIRNKKLHAKAMAFRQSSMKHLTEQHGGKP